MVLPILIETRKVPLFSKFKMGLVYVVPETLEMGRAYVRLLGVFILTETEVPLDSFSTFSLNGESTLAEIVVALTVTSVDFADVSALT